MASAIFYTTANGDGNVWAGDSSWSTVRGQSSGNVSQGNTSDNVRARWVGDPYNSYYIDRIFLPFDTSSLPDNAEIVSAMLVVVFTSASGGTRGIGMVQTTQSDPANLASGDYSRMGTTEGATRETVTEASYVYYEFNSTGLTWINKTGYTLLGLRDGKDIDNTAPSDNTARQIALYEDGTFEPYLVVVYNTNSPSQSPSSSPSNSASASLSPSPSKSPSPSLSPSASMSISPSASKSPSASESASTSPSPPPPFVGIKVGKSGTNVLTETDPTKFNFSSEYGTLKYFDKQTASVTIFEFESGKTTINHDLGYYPFVEVYVGNPYSGYESCPFDGSGATIFYGCTFSVTKTTVELYAYVSGMLIAPLTYNFIVFIFKNNLQLG